MAKRRRLTHKQAAPEIADPRANDEPIAVGTEVPADSREVRPLLMQLYHQLSKFHVRAWDALGPEERRSGNRAVLFRSDMKTLTKASKLKLVAAWQAEGSPWSKSLAAVADAWAKGILASDSVAHNEWKGTQGLFTWNGKFGVLDKVAILGEAWPSVEEVVAVLKMGDHLAELTAEV